MEKQRVCANGPTMSRRTMMTILPVAGVSCVTPSIAQADDRAKILGVIHELETNQPWEISNVVAAKLYAAHIMREALDIETPHIQDAWLHIEYQAATYGGYVRASKSRQATA